MAVPVIATKSEQKEGGNVATTTITAPASIAAGNLLLIVIATDGNSVFSWPTDFVEIDQGFGPSDRCALGAAYKVAVTADESATDYTVTWTGGTEQAIAEMYRITGNTTGQPVQDPDSSNTGSTSPANALAMVTDTDDTLVFACFGMDDDDITVDGGGPGGNWSVEDVDGSNTGANTCAVGVLTNGVTTKGSSGICQLTLTADEEWRAIQFGVRSQEPAAATRRVVVVS
jgi:hypothetical protein